MEKYDYLIVGSGIYGATFAYLAKQHGKKCLVIDKLPHIGGNCYTEVQHGIMVHKYGPHIFHTSDEDVWKFVNQFVTFNNYVHTPVAIYGCELYNLPFNMNTFHTLWGYRTPYDVKNKIERERIPNNNPQNLEEQALSLVGMDIYTKLIKGYSEKQWGRKCTELPPSIIKRLPIRYTFNNNYFRDKYQGIPNEGFTVLFEKLLDGIEVRLNTEFEPNRAYFESICDKIVYTGSIDTYYNYCFGHLEYRALRFKHEYLTDTNNQQGNAVVNYTGIVPAYTRVTEHKLFIDRTEEDINAHEGTILSYEYPEEYNGENIPVYPISTQNNIDLYNKYKESADKDEKVIFGGRLGTYRYMDMGPVIKEALNFWK